MHTAVSVNELIEGVLDEGLSFVATHLEKTINLPIIFTDSSGQIHYPDISDNGLSFESIQILLSINDNEYYYHEADKTLYYSIGCNGSSGYVIIQNLPSHHLNKAVRPLNEAKLAMKCYFSKVNKNRNKFDKALAEHLISGKTDIRNVLKLSDKVLNLDKPYYIAVIQIDGFEHENDMRLRLIKPYVNDYVIRPDIEIITFLCSNHLINIVPTLQEDLQSETEWCQIIDYPQFKTDMEEKFKCSLSCSLSQIYSLSDLPKSFKEALTIQTFSRLSNLGGIGKLLYQYSDLGVFSFVFSQNQADIEQYCFRVLGQLIEYDEKNNSELLNTLRILIDSDFNVKYAAENLYMHVNTLYYRMNRIEQLLNVDLSKVNTRVSLFSAIKVWDTLQVLTQLGLY